MPTNILDAHNGNVTLRVLSRLSVAGSSSAPNEDIVGHTESAAWVLDGATGLGDRLILSAASDAVWLVKSYDALLRQQIGRTDRGLRELFSDTIDSVARAFSEDRVRDPEQRYELPSAGMVLVRTKRDGLEYARLGDCRAIIRLPTGGVLTTKSSPLLDLDAQVVQRMQDLLRERSVRTYREARAAVQDDLRRNRSLQNRDGGYWVLGTEPEAAKHVEIGTLTLAPGDRVHGLLVSDGFYRLVDTFGECRDDGDLLNQALAVGLEGLMTRLRSLEAADPDCTSSMRLKPSDDATALLFEGRLAY